MTLIAIIACIFVGIIGYLIHLSARLSSTEDLVTDIHLSGINKRLRMLESPRKFYDKQRVMYIPSGEDAQDGVKAVIIDSRLGDDLRWVYRIYVPHACDIVLAKEEELDEG